MRVVASDQGPEGQGEGFAPRRPSISLSDIRSVHGPSEDDPAVPAFSRWYRESAVEAVGRFQELAGLTVVRWCELVNLNRLTVLRLLRGGDYHPRWRTLVKLIGAGVIDMRDAAPNIALARQLRPLGMNRRRGRPGRYANWGIGEAIIAWRQARGHRQLDACGLFGCQPSMISAWERGHRLPAPEGLLRLVELHVIDRATARGVLDSGHYAEVTLKATPPEVIAALRR